MSILSYVLRVISLSFLFAGSTSAIFCAITLINAAKERGVPVAVAAGQNAPMFTMYSSVILICAGILLFAEALHYAKHRLLTPAVKARYATSLICVAAALVLKLGIIPQMDLLTVKMQTDPAAKAEFDKLHHASAIDFTVVIVTAMVSLLLPGFSATPKAVAKKPEETQAAAS